MKPFLLYSHCDNAIVHWSDTLDDALELQRMMECSIPNCVIHIFQLNTQFLNVTYKN